MSLHEHPRTLLQGYLGDIGVPPSPDPMDFSAWFEAYLGGGWHTFDPRNNMPRIGRISHWRDGRLAALLLGALRCTRELALGDNEPYPIEEEIDYTIPAHGERRGLPSVMIEIRQDEIRAPADADAWAARIAAAYRRIEAELLRLFRRPWQR